MQITDFILVQMKEMFSERLEFFQNNFYFYGEYALVGTKGYCY